MQKRKTTHFIKWQEGLEGYYEDARKYLKGFTCIEYIRIFAGARNLPPEIHFTFKGDTALIANIERGFESLTNRHIKIFKI